MENQRNEWEWETICDYLVEKLAATERKLLAEQAHGRYLEEENANLKRKLDAAGVE